MFGITKRVEQSKNIYYPLLASERLDNGLNSAEEIGAIWSHLVKLAPEKKNILVSDELPEKMELLQRTLGCGDSTIEGTSVLLRWFYFDEVDQIGFEGGLRDLYGEQAGEVLGFIQKEILSLKPKPRVEEVSETVKKTEVAFIKMPLLQALSKYENLGNQLITNERIKIKSQPEPVRPSLLYWIKYYRDELGIGHHSTVDRGNFLFRSENGKRLSPEERERVNLVLKSVEENYPVDIDTEHSEIIFPAFVAPAPRPQPVPQPVSQPAPVAPAAPRPKPAFNFGQGGMMSGTEVKSAPKDAPAPGNLSFTSKHVFPAEKPTTPVTPTPLRPTPQAPRPAPQVSEAPQPQKNPFRIHPVSLGKVKDNE
jgi:hypothetical protein